MPQQESRSGETENFRGGIRTSSAGRADLQRINENEPDPYAFEEEEEILPPRRRRRHVEVDEDTKFSLKLKDIIVVCAFIVSVTISWTTTDARITRLEEKVAGELSGKIAEVAAEQKEVSKEIRDSVSQIKERLNEMERALFASFRRER